VSDGTVVIGVGSPLMGDDGLGLVALRELRGWAFEPPVELLDGGTWGMNLLPSVESATRLLIIDAVDTGEARDDVVRLEGDAIPRFFSTKLSPHQIDLREVLALAELRDTLPADTVVLGLQPESIEMRTGLSPDVEAKLPDLVDAVLVELRRWGHDARPVPEPSTAPGRSWES